MLEVWAVRFSEFDVDLTTYISFLTENEAKRYFNFYRESDSKLYLNSHVLMKAILNHHTLWTVDQINQRLYTNEYGKPFLKGGPFFSISHTSGMFVMALSDVPIGIDVENNNTVFNTFDFDMIWSPAEKKYLESVTNVSEKKALFFQTWSKKESVVKALGVGLSHPLEKIVTSIRHSTLYQTEKVLLQSRSQSLWFNSLALDLGTGFVGYISGRKPLQLDNIHWINSQEKLYTLLLDAYTLI